MAAPQLTEARIKALRPRKTARDIRDASLKGFGVRVYPSGHRRCVIHSRHDGRRIRKIAGGMMAEAAETVGAVLGRTGA